MGLSIPSNSKRPCPRTEMEIPSSQLSGPCSCQPHTHIQNHPLKLKCLSLPIRASIGLGLKAKPARLRCQSHLPFLAFTLLSYAALLSSLPLLPPCPTNSPEIKGRQLAIQELGLLTSIKTRFSLYPLLLFQFSFILKRFFTR